MLADALGRPMLAEADARPLGKRIDAKVTAVLKQQAAAPKAAAESARNAAAAATKNGAAFDVKQRAAAHERDALSALLAKAYDPKMPNATVGRKHALLLSSCLRRLCRARRSCSCRRRSGRRRRLRRRLQRCPTRRRHAAVERAERKRASLGPRPDENPAVCDRWYSELHDRIIAAALREGGYEHEWQLDWGERRSRVSC